jgi:hypothetical protein
VTAAGVTAAGVIAADDSGAHDNTVLYLLAAIIIAAMAFGYLIWRDRHGPRGHSRGGARRDNHDYRGTNGYRGTNDEGDLS